MTTFELYGIICPNEFKDVRLDIETIPNIESLNGKSPMAFSVLNADEYNLYEMSQNKEMFTGTTESIVIYDVDVEDFYNLLLTNDLSNTHDLVMKKLRKYCSDIIPAAYVYISHMKQAMATLSEKLSAVYAHSLSLCAFLILFFP